MNIDIRIAGGSGKNIKNQTLLTENSIKDFLGNQEGRIILVTAHNGAGSISTAINGRSVLYPNLLILDGAHNTTGNNQKFHTDLIKKNKR